MKMKHLLQNARLPVLVVTVSLLLFCIPFLLAQCRKASGVMEKDGMEVRAFMASPVFKEFTGRNGFTNRVNAAAARVVRKDNIAMVHIPVMRAGSIEGAIIGLPVGEKGRYELLFQDNREALSGTGSLFLYTSANELFRRFDMRNGIIQSMERAWVSGAQSAKTSTAELECGFKCRLDKCYNETKARFPGDAVCSLLDIFFGVCSIASVTTCLIKMATK